MKSKLDHYQAAKAKADAAGDDALRMAILGLA